MNVDEIIKQVRWCIDEESNNSSSIIDEKEDEYMDNIIKAKIPDAVNWVCLNAPAQSFVIGRGSDTEVIKDYSTATKEGDGVSYENNWDSSNGIGCISFPKDTPLRLIRLRGSDWHKAIMSPSEEDSDEALFMYDASAKGTTDRPQAVIVRGNPTRILVQPASDSFELSFVHSLDLSSVDSDTDISLPETLRSSVIYYIAFLLLSAYDDSKSEQMYRIALQQLGVNEQTK